VWLSRCDEDYCNGPVYGRASSWRAHHWFPLLTALSGNILVKWTMKSVEDTCSLMDIVEIAKLFENCSFLHCVCCIYTNVCGGFHFVNIFEILWCRDIPVCTCGKHCETGNFWQKYIFKYNFQMNFIILI